MHALQEVFKGKEITVKDALGAIRSATPKQLISAAEELLAESAADPERMGSTYCTKLAAQAQVLAALALYGTFQAEFSG